MKDARGPFECVEIHSDLTKVWELNGPVGCARSLILAVLAHVAVIPADTPKPLQLFSKMSIFLFCFLNLLMALNFLFNTQ